MCSTHTMPRIRPKVEIEDSFNDCSTEPTTLTVWHKSLLFDCNGFTVYHSNGNLLFRVDNYCSNRSREIVLMDALGNELLSLQHKVYSHIPVFLADFGLYNLI